MATQERAVRTRRALIRAAAEVFASEGYVPASLPVISDRAGVSRGALHFHFKSKDDLACAVEEEAAQALDQVIASAWEGPALPGLQLLAVVAGNLVAVMESDVVIRAGFQMDGDITRKGGGALSRRWQDWVGETLRRAERRGELADGVSWRAVEATVLASTVGLQALAARNADWRPVERVRQIWGLLLLVGANRHAPESGPDGLAGTCPSPRRSNRTVN
ncbi:ScbR family autoregulator-binding transcription factor [Streptomyces sp. NPDC090119]|uniref:ScbR family autoregulator-binding transcription factor n=1 Tax=Streptomyces sp. NPDC090119 TaxID=3365951 RepID=UPI00382D573E